MKPTWLEPFALKFNPFADQIPVEALLAPPAVENFLSRVTRGLVRDGGFALLVGDPGLGKSATLRILTERLEELAEVEVRILQNVQCSLADFYRELGDLYGVPLRPHNRWNGFKALRERWQNHMDGCRTRPVLLVDEAQLIKPVILNEMRLLASAELDSRNLLAVVLAGDQRLLDQLRTAELQPLDSRMRIRLHLQPAAAAEMEACLRHLITAAGNPKLIDDPVVDSLADHAMGNRRTLIQMADELLQAASDQGQCSITQKLLMEIGSTARPATTVTKRRRR